MKENCIIKSGQNNARNKLCMREALDYLQQGINLYLY